MIQTSSGVPVAVPMQGDVRFVADQTVSPVAQDNQPQRILSLDSREIDNLPPPYEAVVSGYRTVQVDMPPPYASVSIQAGDDIVEFQTVTLGAHEDQPQIYQLPGSSAIENPPPSYEDVASGYQTVHIDLSPPYASVPIQAGDDVVEFQTITLGTQGNQPQVVQLPDSSSGVENPPPLYEDVTLGYQNVQVDIPPPYASVPIQAGDGIVEVQTVSSGAQEDQFQMVELPGSLAMENPPPSYEDVASSYQTLQFDVL